jgi:hypothetical protein
MAIQTEIKEAADSGREELLRTLASHHVLPTVVEQAESSLLGESSTPTFRFESEAENTSVADRQTSALAADTLGLSSGDDCESVREEIRAHDAWDES